MILYGFPLAKAKALIMANVYRLTTIALNRFDLRRYSSTPVLAIEGTTVVMIDHNFKLQSGKLH